MYQLTDFKKILLSAVFSVLSFFYLSAYEIHPVAEQGVLDLRSWSFEEDGPADLNGEWFFNWHNFIEPVQDKNFTGTDFENSFFTIPGYWNNRNEKGTLLTGKGYASLLLKVLLPENSELLAIKTHDIQTAYSIYADGKKLYQVGVPGKDEKTSKPFYSSVVKSFQPEGSVLYLTIHLTNFHHRKGGIWGEIQLGREADIMQQYQRARLYESFLLSAIIFMGLYHIYLYILFKNKKDKAALYFGIFCILIALRTLTTGETLGYSQFAGAGWAVLHRTEYITFFLATPCFMLYLRQLFPVEYNKTIARITLIASFISTAVTLLTPSYIYTYTSQPYQIFTFFIGIYIIVRQTLAAYRKKEGARVIMLGFIIMFLLVINDMLYTNQYIHTGMFLPVGLLIFIFSQSILIAHRFSNAFNTVEIQTGELTNMNQSLMAEIKKRKELEINLLESHEHFAQSRYGIIMGLAKLAEYRDEDTGSHLERMREYSKIIAARLSRHPRFIGYIKEEYIEDLYQSAILHDIGKVGVSDSVLLKPGKLNREEFDAIKKHPAIGGDAIKNIESRINVQSFLTLGREIAYYHHEKWDGSGYPMGLKGEKIPLSARIVALADVYDALTSERPYKAAFSHEKASSIIIEGKGSHFDPVIVEAFEASQKEFISIRESFHLEHDSVHS